MTKINYPETSPYALTTQSNWAIGRYQHRRIPPASTDGYEPIPAEFNMRPDLMAAKLYGNAELYWVFMVRNLNVIRDPFWDFLAGVSIYIPTKETLKAALGI